MEQHENNSNSIVGEINNLVDELNEKAMEATRSGYTVSFTHTPPTPAMASKYKYLEVTVNPYE